MKEKAAIESTAESVSVTALKPLRWKHLPVKTRVHVFIHRVHHAVLPHFSTSHFVMLARLVKTH